jgi:hypothetical protein
MVRLCERWKSCTFTEDVSSSKYISQKQSQLLSTSTCFLTGLKKLLSYPIPSFSVRASMADTQEETKDRGFVVADEGDTLHARLSVCRQMKADTLHARW